jgi:hypothetical protein
LEAYYIALAQPINKTIPASFYDNIINHETKKCFKKYLFHVHYIMIDILIPINEGIAKFFTLMVKGHLNKLQSLNEIPTSSWDTCIHHETWKGIA